MSFKPFRIEICGGIAAGKTTLSKLLGNLSLYVINENFEANPFLHEFYSNSPLFSFETELTFLLQHYHAIKSANKSYNNIVCDYCFVLDLAYADLTLTSEAEKKIFVNLFNEISKQVTDPDLIVYLKCAPEAMFKRIISRGREMERGLTIESLSILSKSLDNRIKENTRPEKLIVLDSEKYNFFDNQTHKQAVIEVIKSQLPPMF